MLGRAEVRRHLIRAALACGAALGVSACQTVAGAAVQPAVLLKSDAQSLETIQRVLSEVTRQGRITLGPGDLTRQSVITVLPQPPGIYEGNSPAMPTYFELVTDQQRCYVRERGKDELHALPDVDCRAD